MHPLVTLTLVILGLAGQLVAGYLLFAAQDKPANRSALILTGCSGTCLICVLAFLRHDAVLLVGESVALLAGGYMVISTRP